MQSFSRQKEHFSRTGDLIDREIPCPGTPPTTKTASLGKESKEKKEETPAKKKENLT